MREIRKKKRRIGGWELRHERSDWLSEVRQLGIRTRAKRLAERSEAIYSEKTSIRLAMGFLTLSIIFGTLRR